MSHGTPSVQILADSGYGSSSDKATNTSMDVDAPSPTLKRKASLDNAQTTVKDVKKPAAKKQKPDAKENDVELKAGKLVWKQKGFDIKGLTATIQEQLDFRTFLDARDNSLKEIPSERYPLFSKLVHESEKNLNELTKEIKKLVDPENEDSQGGTGSKVSLDVIKTCIQKVAERKNYGLTIKDSPDGDAEPPSAICIWRWEAKDFSHFPEDQLAKLRERHGQRQDAQTDARALASGLSYDDLTALFTKGGKKISGPAKPKKEAVVDIDGDDCMQVDEKPARKTSSKSKKAAAPPEPPKEETPEEREKREAEEAEKEAEKAEKEAQKEIKKAEKEAKKQKEDAKQKATKASAGLFSSWLGKPAKAPTSAAAKPSSSPEVVRIVKPAASTSTSRSTEEPEESDFDKTFLPFQLKKGFTLAPINRFTEGRDAPREVEINTHEDLTLKTVLAEFMADVPASRIPRGATRPRPAVVVAELMQAITEGELSGNGGRKYYNQLRDRTKLPVKLLKFHSDHRPGYRGTWTKYSSIIRPRNPLARDDEMLRYDYDSGDEWEEEPEEGEDVDMEDPEEEELSEDSDGEGWLAGDDEVEYEEGFDPDADGEQANENDDPSAAQAKRVVAKRSQAIANKKRKITGPLQPVCKGPCFETSVGNVEWDILQNFRIQFLNEARPGLDPLTYEAATPEWVKTGQTSLKGFYTTSAPSSSKPSKPVSSAPSSKKAGPGKSVFPTTDLPAFIEYIETTDITGKAKLREALHARFASATKVSVEELFKAHVKQTGSVKSKNLQWVISEELLNKARPAASASS